MALSEFELIREYFLHAGSARDDVVLGVGDDCALLKVPDGMHLALSIDTLVEGIHFFPDVAPEDLGHKALAVNLSDLAAMGAEPSWVTLALTMPVSDEAWLRAFSQGFSDLARTHGVQLVGGDTTRGPLTISVQVHGFVEPGRALRRDAARQGELIYVTGPLRNAGIAVKIRQGTVDAGIKLSSVQPFLDRPQPRVEEGRVAAQFAKGGIDISDGLLSDLGYICRTSGVGARLELQKLPMSRAVKAYVERSADWGVVLAAGDDYELCLTVPAEQRDAFERHMAQQGFPVYCIGVTEEKKGIRCILPDGNPLSPLPGGYEHFSHE